MELMAQRMEKKSLAERVAGDVEYPTEVEDESSNRVEVVGVSRLLVVMDADQTEERGCDTVFG